MSKYLKADTYELTPISITRYQQQESNGKITNNKQIFKNKKIDPNQKNENKSNSTLSNVEFIKTNKRKLEYSNYSIERRTNKKIKINTNSDNDKTRTDQDIQNKIRNEDEINASNKIKRQKKNTLPECERKNIKLSNQNKQKYGTNLNESIKIFTDLISHGPIYVCSVCHQTNFKDKVIKINNIKKLNIYICCMNAKQITNL